MSDTTSFGTGLRWAMVTPVRCALVLTMLASMSCAPAPGVRTTPTTSDRFFVAGYHPYWAGDSWRDYPAGVLDELFFFELEVAGDGGFLDRHGWPGQWRAMKDDAETRGTTVTPTVSMHDADAFEALFQDAAAIDRLVEGLLRLLTATDGLGGLHLDFEVFRPVEREARDGFTSFVARLAGRMDELDPRQSLSIFVLAFDDADVYDEGALAALADYVVVQGYDFHSMESRTAGPVGALTGWGRLNWGHVVDRFVEIGVPRRKIVMAVPLYGYQWPVESESAGARTRGVALALPYAPPDDVLPELPRARERAEEVGARRDEASGSPYYTFADADGWHQAWFDDEISLRAKYDFVRARGLGGVALFPAAYADESLWASVREAFSGRRF